ncbi:hypothetical protein ACLOJK_029549 [Asimina triloba]
MDAKRVAEQAMQGELTELHERLMTVEDQSRNQNERLRAVDALANEAESKLTEFKVFLESLQKRLELHVEISPVKESVRLEAEAKVNEDEVDSGSSDYNGVVADI